MRIPMPLAGLVASTLFLTTAVAQGDECTAALVVIDGVNGPFTNVGATTSVPAWPCGGGGSDVWFLYVATCTGQATFDTCSATRTFDTTLEVFDGVAQPCGSMTGGVCNDDTCGLQSSVTINVTTGNPYYIRVGGFNSGTGNFDLNITCTGGGGVQNDECTNPTVLVDGPNGPFTNAGSTTSTPPWPCAGGGNDVWFLYVASCTGTLTFDTCSPNTTYDTALEVYDATCGGCGTFTIGTCNDDSCGLQSSVTVCATTGQLFYLRVGGFVGLTGNFDLNVNCTAGPCGGGGGAGNDECAGATVATLGVNAGTNVGASTSNPAWPCGAGANDVWYSFTATCTGPHTFETCSPNTTYDTTLEVFSGPCGCPVSLGCNDDFCGLQSTLQVSLTAGQTYFVRVGGFGGQTGSFDLNIVVGTGAGTIGLTNASTCAGGLTISVTGNPNIGGAVTTTLGGITGVSFFTWDLFAPGTAPGNCSPCPLLLGSFGWNFGTGNTLNIPCDASYIGVNVFAQGVEIFGASGCVLPPALTLSDVYQIVIG
ncbi:MAG: hypothetical protein IPK26_03330 [Planctomycetes bacterium]|nr:hypothetical protein [Planctomycetota bacterium]